MCENCPRTSWHGVIDLTQGMSVREGGGESDCRELRSRMPGQRDRVVKAMDC